VNLDAAAIGGPGEPPDDRVVPDDAPGRMVEGAHDRPGHVLGEIEHGAEPRDLRWIDEAARDAEQLIDLRPLGHRHERPLGMGEGQVPVLREEQVEVEVEREPLVERHAAAVELRALRRAVVGADDRRVPAGCAGADVALLEDGDVCDAVISCQVVGHREAV